MALPDHLFEPLGIVNSLKRAAEVLGEKPALFLIIHAAIVLLIALVVEGLMRFFWHMPPWIQLFAYNILLCPAEGATIRGVAEMYASKKPSLAICVNHSLSKFSFLLGACALINLGICIPSWLIDQVLGAFWTFPFFLFVAALVTVLTYHTYPAIMLESLGASDGIGRSVALTKDNRIHIFLVWILFVFGSWVVLYVIRLLPLVGQMLGFLASIALAAFGSV